MSVYVVDRGPTEAIIAQQLADGTYEGRNLADLYQAEISRYASPWEWARDRIDSGYYVGVHVGDYIPAACTNGVHIDCQIAGIDTYTDSGAVETPRHIDFVSRELWPVKHTPNRVDTNNGTATQPSPWLASDLHHWLCSLSGQVPGGVAVGGTPLVQVDYTTDGVWYYLPPELQAAISGSVPKRVRVPYRYSAAGLISDDANWGEQSLGRLWLPYEMEVYGTAICGCLFRGIGGFVQYPLFADGMRRIKTLDGTRDYWWLASAFAYNATAFCLVQGDGSAHAGDAHYGTPGVPVCFRLTGG